MLFRRKGVLSETGVLFDFSVFNEKCCEAGLSFTQRSAHTDRITYILHDNVSDERLDREGRKNSIRAILSAIMR